MEIDLDFDRRQIGFLAAGILLGLIASTAFSALSPGNPSQDFVSFLENQSGQDLEVVNSQRAGRFYQVDVRTPDDQLTTYYTDGERFTANMQSREQIQTQTASLNNFSQCLQDSQTVMFGNSSQQATQQQIQVLGGVNVVAPIYQDVSNNQTLQPRYTPRVETPGYRFGLMLNVWFEFDF